MAYLCVDKNEKEKIFNNTPSRDGFGINDTFGQYLIITVKMITELNCPKVLYSV